MGKGEEIRNVIQEGLHPVKIEKIDRIIVGLIIAFGVLTIILLIVDISTSH